MQIRMPAALAVAYKSAAQRTRVVSEAWAEQNLYCPSCTSSHLNPSAPSTEAVDFTCPECESPFQLKSQSRPFARRITDAAYQAMRRAILEGRTPNLLALHYEPACWEVQNLILVPRFVFSLSAIEVRKPLGATARRRGWVGCNILLSNIPPEARIPLIAHGRPQSPAAVRKHYARLRPLENLTIETRGWTLDVWNVVGGLRKTEFSLEEVYAFASLLARLHPRNRHVRDKIRQQLQILRDMGFLIFLGRGSYRLKI